MSGLFALDWAALAFSVFDALACVWLGLTVWLNADRRNWGIWLAGGGLLMGGAFFLSHSALLASGLQLADPALDLWWRAGWAPVIMLPFAWYLVILWYAGYRRRGLAALPAWQRLGLTITGGSALGLLAFLGFSPAFPSLSQVLTLNPARVSFVSGLPLLAALYPVYSATCVAASLVALLRPGPAERVMGDLARLRARPWLIATALALLAVSLMVGGMVAWVLYARNGRPQDLLRLVAWFDFLSTALIALAVLLLGQAIVAYEVFTGKTLPRRGLARQFHGAMILSAGYAVFIGWTLTASFPPAYSLLATGLLMAGFAALLGWRSFSEREGFIRRLRPFVTGAHLTPNLLSVHEEQGEGFDWSTPFEALCREVLDAGRAQLVSLGSMAPLVGAGLSYPAGDALPALSPERLENLASSRENLWVRLDPGEAGPYSWAVPLWGGRGLVGVLLLSGKEGGGLYAQEEIELARTVAERLIDNRASAQLARRLMSLQRQRFRETVVADQQTRRVLHDEVLPLLHTALIALEERDIPADSIRARVSERLTAAHRQLADLLQELPRAAAPEVRKLGLVGALQQAVAEEWQAAFDRVDWQVDPQAEERARALPDLSAEVVYFAACEALRNAARHGRSAVAGGPFVLSIRVGWDGGLRLILRDTGAGIERSSREPGQHGTGLSLHSTMMAVVGGSLTVQSDPGVSTQVALTLPEGQMGD